MKRLISLMLFISLCTFSGFAQNNNNVDLSDEIYQIIKKSWIHQPEERIPIGQIIEELENIDF